MNWFDYMTDERVKTSTILKDTWYLQQYHLIFSHVQNQW